MIMVKDTGSPYFDCAYFVLKSELPVSAASSDILEEARRIMAACNDECVSVSRKKPSKPRSHLLWIIIPAAVFLLGGAVLVPFLIL